MPVPSSVAKNVRYLKAGGLGWEDVCVSLRIVDANQRATVRAMVLGFLALRGAPGGRGDDGCGVRRPRTSGGQPMSEWQPIETAPHEVLVLLYSPAAWPSEAKFEVGFASTGKEWPAPDGGRYSNRFIRNHLPAVAFHRSHHGYATHWMPLPKPPVQS